MMGDSSVVTKSVPTGEVCVGNPTRCIKNVDVEDNVENNNDMKIADISGPRETFLN